jgi:hypothetical protein
MLALFVAGLVILGTFGFAALGPFVMMTLLGMILRRAYPSSWEFRWPRAKLMRRLPEARTGGAAFAGMPMPDER